MKSFLNNLRNWLDVDNQPIWTAILKTGLRAFVVLTVLSAVLYPDKFLANPTQRVFMGFVWSMILAVIVYFYFKRKYDG